MKINYLFCAFIILMLPDFSYSQFDLEKKENIVHQFSFSESFEVFKNTDTNTFFITNENEKILVKKLKFCENLNGSLLQVLDKKNRIIYFNNKLKKVKRPEQINYVACGNETVYYIEIVEKKEFYLVKKYIKTYKLKGNPKNEILFTLTFPKRDYEKVYLINRKNKLEFSDYNIYPMFVIVEKGFRLGVLNDGEIKFYDYISSDGKFLKVKKNDLWNIYNFSSKVKYKVLNKFIDNLAYFELPNGKSGYLSKKGDEYFN